MRLFCPLSTHLALTDNMPVNSVNTPVNTQSDWLSLIELDPFKVSNVY